MSIHHFRSDEAGEELFEDEDVEYIYYDDEGDYEDARSRSSKALQGHRSKAAEDRLDTAETSYAKNRLRDEPHLAKAAKARLLSSAAKGKFGGNGGNRDAIK